MNRYLKKIASKDNQKLKRIGTGAAIGAGAGGAGAAAGGYISGNLVGSGISTMITGLSGADNKTISRMAAESGHKVGKAFAGRLGAVGAAAGAGLGAGAGYLVHRKKLLEKAASLLKGKRFVGTISPKRFKFRGSIDSKDVDAFDKLHTLHGTVQRQVEKGAPAIKHRLELGDGSKAFIRASSKGVRSRLYRE